MSVDFNTPSLSNIIKENHTEVNTKALNVTPNDQKINVNSEQPARVKPDLNEQMRDALQQNLITNSQASDELYDLDVIITSKPDLPTIQHPTDYGCSQTDSGCHQTQSGCNQTSVGCYGTQRGC